MSTPLSQPSIAVLVSAGRHPISGTARACRGDAVALELARRLAGDRLSVVHAGDANEPALGDYLAYGAQRIEVLQTPQGSDVVSALAARLRDVDLIITGMRSERGTGSGLLPYVLAQSLGRPVVANVLEAQVAGKEVEIRQFLPKGKRRGVAVSMPAVLAVHPLAPVDLRYAHARRVAGRIEPLQSAHTAEAAWAAQWTVEAAQRQPLRLKAREKKTGHARMQSAIVAESKGGFVAIEGTCVDKAQVMLAYLREHRLIDF